VKKLFFLPLAMFLVISLVAGCTLASLPQQNVAANIAVASAGIGNVEIRVTDAPRHDDVTAIWVKVDEVQIHKAGTSHDADNDDNNGEWITANISGPNPFELLALKNGGIYSILGNLNLTSGNYTQIRLVVDEVKVTINGENLTATVPSGKIKFVHRFEVVAGKTTTLLFDFDAAKSVKVISNKNHTKVMFKPVIKLTSEKPQHCNDDNKNDDDNDHNVDNHAGKIQIAPTTLTNGTIGGSYNVALTASDGSAPYSWALIDGALPTGMSVDNTSGTSSINGTPTVSGIFHFTAGVADNGTPQKTGTRSYTLTIVGNQLTINNSSPIPSAKHGLPYTHTFEATGGTGTLTWTAVGLPASSTLAAATGVFSWSVPVLGPYNFTIKVTDQTNLTVTKDFTLTVTP
jgi:hypothetical protein